jgi:putative transposase
VQLRYRYRLDPAPRHVAALARAFGCARMVFNDALRARQQAHAARPGPTLAPRGEAGTPPKSCH